MTRATRRRSWRGVLAGLAIIATLAVGLSPVDPPAAVAADAADWDPGFIIDDSKFYDSNAMSAQDIQAFLDGKVTSCRSGATCLKDYAQSTDNRPADRYCDGYTGSGRQTAAQIIDNVARSCGISQRVLLVMLEKEQSLITSRSPEAWNYTAAMGQGCPDTAPCDPSTQGFFYQVYYGARQFEVYRLNPDSFGYRAQRWNNILYNPNTGCGTRSVFIKNQASAGLYIYTPYTPNAAALANLYGMGDGCSSYGNRNFWRIYSDWFGDPRSYTVHPGFVDYWNSRGGAAGVMGPATSDPVYLEANGQGWYQRFRGGVVYGSFAGGTAFVFDNVILAEYNRQGGPSSGMSWPNGEQMCTPNGQCMQTFVGASITTTSTYGARTIWGGLNDYWKSSGSLYGRLGAAIGDVEYRTAGSLPSWVQRFEKGVLSQNPYGIYLVPAGETLRTWERAGGGEGWLGWPTSDYVCAAKGCAQSFQGGVITWSASFGTHVVLGGFVPEWQRRGGLESIGPAYNGLATSSAAGGGWVQNFASGILTQSAAGMVLVPYGPEQAVWSASGDLRGWLGWPQADRACVASGCGQRFQGGAITTSPDWGTRTTFGGLYAAWSSAGGLDGYGVAFNDVQYSDANGGGWRQHFASGILTQQRGGGVIYTPSSRILDMWYGYGAEWTWLGWPTSAQTCTAEGCVQQFQNGVARSDAAGRVSFTPR